MRLSNLPSLIWLVSLACLPFAAGPNYVSGADLKSEKEEIAARLEQLPLWTASSQAHGRIGFYGQPKKAQWIMIDLGARVTLDEVILFPARLPVDGGGDGSEGFPPEIEVEIATDDSFSDAVRIGRWEEPVPGGSLSPPFLRFETSGTEQHSGRYLRVRIFGSRLRASGRGNYYTLG